MVKGKNKKSEVTNPTEAVCKLTGDTIDTTMMPTTGDWSKMGILVFVNGKKLEPEALKSFQIQYTNDGALLVVEINYEDKIHLKEATISKEFLLKNKPSTKGISVMESKDPEIYDLQEDDMLKLQAMSALRTNKTEDGKPISKLQALINLKEDFEEMKIEDKEIVTGSYDISALTSISSALNDLAVQEQKIQRDPEVLKVEIIQKPKIVYVNDTFTIVEKFKLYKVEKKDGE